MVSEGRPPGSALEVLAVATRLGLTSFGGPVAHLGYFHDEYVSRRRWLDEASYADVVALCQSLPGPASSQVGIAIGTLRAGLLGGLLAWLGFTLPSAVALVAFAFGLDALGDVSDAGWLHGLKIAAVAVVAFAVWSMARTLAPDRERASIAVLAAILVLAEQTAAMQLAVIGGGGVIGWLLYRRQTLLRSPTLHVPIGRGLAVAAWVVFFALLLGLPVLRQLTDGQALAVFDSFYRTGSLVFGGGHVVLPLLQAEVVEPGWLSQDDFIAGYGAAQAVPGPLFTFSAYLGASFGPEPNDIPGATLALVAIFLPSYLLIIGGLPVWGVLRQAAAFQAALRGVNAAVVGLLLAALYTPVWTSAVFAAEDFALAIAAFVLLAFWRLPPWLVVLFAAAGGELIAQL
jgi:chromate transporter